MKPEAEEKNGEKPEAAEAVGNTAGNAGMLLCQLISTVLTLGLD